MVENLSDKRLKSLNKLKKALQMITMLLVLRQTETDLVLREDVIYRDAHPSLIFNFISLDASFNLPSHMMEDSG